MWLLILTLSVWSSKTVWSQNLSASDQLPVYKNRTKGHVYNLTDDNGAPVYDTDISDFNRDLFDDTPLLQSFTRLTSERIPLRVLHTKGAGAHGYFEVTKNISDICKAKVFSADGKQTKVIVRFSNQFGLEGAADSTREAKGFSVKFYTEEGNLDFVSLSFPVFDLKNPYFFPSLVHALRRNPQTFLSDVNAVWDFLTSRNESLFFGLYNFADGGIPYSYRYIRGFPIHTYQIYNHTGNVSYVRFRFEPDAGVLNLNSSVAQTLAGASPDYYSQDLFEAILNGNYPSWTLSMQYMSKEDTENATFNPFDVTLLWPEKQYPYTPIGKLVLNETLKNFFAENEQLSFCPGNLVPGINGGADKMFEARRFTYELAARHRLGSNFHKIKVNCPLMSQVHTYSRDVSPPVGEDEGNAPSYFPNSFNGPEPIEDKNKPRLVKPYVDPAATNLEQAGDFYEGLTEAEKSRLIDNIVSSLSSTIDSLQEKAINIFTSMNKELGQGVSDGLKNATTTDSDPEPIQDYTSLNSLMPSYDMKF